MQKCKKNLISLLFLSLSLIVATNGEGSIPASGRHYHNRLLSRLTRTLMVASDPTVGSVSGKLNVTATGALNYDIPIAAPPGTAGMAPKLTLSYNSQQKNGIVGMGFSLQGLTAIARAPQNYAQNGKIHGVDFTADDRFSLNGQQLVAKTGQYGADGAEYRTYIDSYSKIVSSGSAGTGPAGFKVWTKGGQIAEYGMTPDSQMKANVKNPDGTVVDAQTIKSWGLDKIEDRSGNYLTVHYHNDPETGEFYPIEIDYTGNDAAQVAPYNSIKFTYEDRPDVQTLYHAGSKTTVSKRLSEIQAYQGTTLVYDYHLSYEISPNTSRSRLTSIQECDGQGVCFKPTTFSWQTNEEGWDHTSTKLPKEFVYEGSDATQYRGDLMDLNGDGLRDYLVSYKGYNGDSENGAWLFDSTNQSWDEDSNYVLSSPMLFMTKKGPGHRGHFADLNGSGLLDYVVSYNSSSDGSDAHAYMNTGDAWSSSSVAFPTKDLSVEGDDFVQSRGVLSDLTGNGLSDVILSYQGYSGDKEDNVWLNQQTSWQEAPDFHLPYPMFYTSKSGNYQRGFLSDVNGDGLQDYVASYRGFSGDTVAQVWLNTGSHWEPAPYAFPTTDLSIEGNDFIQMRGQLIDLNGDGLPDVVISYLGYSGDTESMAWVNTGRGWVEDDNYKLPEPMYYVAQKSGPSQRGYFVDLTGNGLPDYVYSYTGPTGTKNEIFINTGHGWQQADYAVPMEIEYEDDRSNVERGQFADLYGSGLADIVFAYRGYSGDTVFETYQHKGKMPDYLIKVTDGLGESTAIDYESLSNSAVNLYTKDHDAKYPNMDYQGPMYVVYQTASSNPINDPVTLDKLAQPGFGDQFKPKTSPYSTIPTDAGNQHITTYTYEGAKFNHLGYGFLGFKKQTVTDNTTGISKTTTYSQDTTQHTTGQVIATQTQTKTGTIISSTSSHWTTKCVGDGNANTSYYQVTADKLVKNNFSLAGKPVSTQTIATTTNDYGDPTDIVSTTQDSTTGGVYTTETKNTYQEDPTNWILGNVTDTSVTKSAPNVPSITRTSHFNYDSNGFLQQTIVSPSDPNYTLTTTYNSRDAFGNILSTTISGRDIQTRTSTVTYDPYGRYIVSTTNALNQTVTQTIDPRFGKPTQSTDLNGLVTTYQYDGFGRLMQTAYPNKTVDTTAYQWTTTGDPAGSIYKVIKQATDSPTVTLYYDELNRQIAKTTQGFDGRLIWQKSQYDELGRMTQKSLPFYAGDQEYDARMDYDDLGRLTKTTRPDGKFNQIIYDGLTTTTINVLGQKVTKTANVQGKIIKAIDNLGNETDYQYDAYGNLTQTLDSKQNKSTIIYDNFGRKIALDDPDSGKTTYSYDQLGNVLSQTDSNGNTVTLAYDALNRLIARKDPAGTSAWEYGTDINQHNVGLLTTVNGIAAISHHADGSVTVEKPTGTQIVKATQDGLQNYTRTIEYNDLSLPESEWLTINGQQYHTTTEYDADSRPDKITYANGVTIQNHYNTLGYLSSVSNMGTAQTYYQVSTMNADGKVTSFTRSNGLVTTKSYDPTTGFLLNIKTNPTQSLEIQQQIFGWPFKKMSKAQIKHIQNQQAKRKGKSTGKAAAAGDVQSLTYVYDALGNVKSRADSVNQTTQTYNYDDLDRITSWQETGSITDQRSYTYDALGNITNKSNVGNYIYDGVSAGPHAVTAIQDATGKTIANFGYDKDGNQTSANWFNDATKNRTITYTSYEKPLQIDTANANVKFYYNADRSRFMRVDYDKKTATTSTTLYLNNYELVSHTNSQGTQTEMKIYAGPNTVLVVRHDSTTGKISSHTYEMMHDNIGSVTGITDENGNITQHFEYAPFGEQLAEGTQTEVRKKLDSKQNLTAYPVTHKGFTGQEEIESVGLIHMNGRIYDPNLGRFLSADPYIQDPTNSQSLNRYTYCFNNPLAFTDPTGFTSIFKRMFSNPTIRIAVGVIIGVALSFTGIGVCLAAAIGALITSSLALCEGTSIGEAALEGAITFAVTVGVHASIANAIGMSGPGSGAGNIAYNAGSSGISMTRDLPGGGAQTQEGSAYADQSFYQNSASSNPYTDSQTDGEIASQQTSDNNSNLIVGSTYAPGKQSGAKTAAFAVLFNDGVHESIAQIVYRPVHAPILSLFTNHPLEEHIGIKMANGDIYGYFEDSRVKIDKEYANEYKVMTERQVSEIYGRYGVTKNSFNNETMGKALRTEEKTWDIKQNSNAEPYHFLAERPLREEHNCQNFVYSVVNKYVDLIKK